MKILAEIPRSLQGRGHNECTPVECDCGVSFLMPLDSRSAYDEERKAHLIVCPSCRKSEAVPATDIVTHNGQVK